jgi:hypothetical protein
MASPIRKLTPEQVQEVERRLMKPQACRVVAYRMGVPLSQVLEVRTKLRARQSGGAPLKEFGESENASAMPRFNHAGGEE